MPTTASILLKKLEAEARSGFPNLRGTTVNATVPISQTLVNEILASAWDVLTVDLQSGNQLKLRILGLPTLLDATIVGIDSSLTLTLRVSMLAQFALLFLKGKLPPFASVQGRDLLFDFGQIPRVAAWHSVWQYIRITTSTSPGLLSIFATLKVN